MLGLLLLALVIAVVAVVLGATLHGLFWLILIVAAVVLLFALLTNRGTRV
jgi:hypothetical protein